MVSLKLYFNVPNRVTLAKGRIFSVKRWKNQRDQSTPFARTNMIIIMVYDRHQIVCRKARNDSGLSGFSQNHCLFESPDPPATQHRIISQ